MKIAHIADLHIGREIAGLPAVDRISTLRSIAAECAGMHALLVAGDLFDSITDDSVKAVLEIFTGLTDAGCRVFLVPGESESALPVWSERLQAPGITVFTGNECSDPAVLEADGERVLIYGARSTDITTAAHRTGEGCHIGLFHFDIDTIAPTETELKPLFKSLPLDFYALGGNHAVKLYKSGMRITAAYPGSAFPASELETGDRYMLKFSVINSRVSDIKRIAVNTRKLEHVAIEAESSGPLAIEEALRRKSGMRSVCTVTIRGCRDFSLPDSFWRRMETHFCSLTVQDCSHPSLEQLHAEFGDEDSLRGEFFRTLAGMERDGRFPEELDRSMTAGMIWKLLNSGAVSEDWLCALLNA